MSVTRNDALNFIDGEIQHFEAVIRIESDPTTLNIYSRNIEIMKRIRCLVEEIKDGFDPELHKFAMCVTREVRFSREFVVEARNEDEATEMLRDCLDVGEILMDETVMSADDEEIFVSNPVVFNGSFDTYGEVTEGIWEV